MAMMRTMGFGTDFLEFKPEEVILHCLDESSDIVVEEMKKVIATNVRNKDRSTGELINSICANKAKINDKGEYSVWIGPKGTSKKYYLRKTKTGKGRKHPLNHAAKLIWMEYGRNDQPATPVLAKTVNASSNKVYEKMQNTFDREVGD